MRNPTINPIDYRKTTDKDEPGSKHLGGIPLYDGKRIT